MNPIFITLFAVVVTLVLTLTMVQRQEREISPAMRRGLWAGLIIGVIVLIVLSLGLFTA